MAIKIRRYIILLFLSFIFNFFVYSQTTEDKQSLSAVFSILEERFKVQFNYAEDLVSEIKIISPDDALSLEGTLVYLESVTNFSFQIIADNTILVLANPTPFILQELSEVMVSGYIVKGINKLSNGSFEIDISDFDILPGLVDTDVLQAVQAFPGIQSINETVSNINIRGGSHDQNLILWDDIKMYQSGHFFGLISMFNPQITQRVSLTKNGSGTEFTDGVSGIISMQSDREVTKAFKGNIGVNFIDANGFVDVPLGDSSLQIAARKSISDFTETPTYNNFFERISQDTEVENNATSIINSDKAFDFYDMSLRWIYRINDKEELRVNFINVTNELVFNENATIDSVEDSRESSLSQNSIAGSVAYSRIWNDKWLTTFEGYETDYKLKSINANLLDSQRFLQENKVSETSLKLKVDYKINEHFNLLSGYHFVETEITNLDDVDVPRFKLLISEVVRTHGIFSQLYYKSKDKNTNITSGLRYNYIEKFGKRLLEPRFSLSHKFLDHFSVEVLGEFKHQNASQIINFQNDFLGIEKRRWQLSNDRDIPVIKSRQVSLGVSYDKSGWLFSAETYFKKVQGITTQSQGFQNQYEFVRTSGSNEVKGIDVLIRKRLDRFNSWLSYSFMDSEYEFKDLAENTFPSNFNIRHAVTLGTNYSSNRLKLSAGLNWNSGRPTTQPVINNAILNGEINYESTNTSELKSYLRVDLSALYDLKLSAKTKANLGLSIWNVLDRENIINSFYRISNDEVTEIQQRSLGITPNVVFRVNF